MEVINIKKNPAELTEIGATLEPLLPESPIIGFCGGRSIVKILEPLKKHVAENFFSKFLTASYLMIDERIVPLEDKDSNYKIINNNYYNFIKDCTKHAPTFLPFLSDKVETSLNKYSALVAENNHAIDLVFLGVGEDGHIAGLFPNFTWDENSDFFTFENSPKPPSHRMTASPKLIKSAKVTVLLFIGEGKRDAYNKFMEGNMSINELPCLLCKEAKNLFIITDLS